MENDMRDLITQLQGMEKAKFLNGVFAKVFTN